MIRVYVCFGKDNVISFSDSHRNFHSHKEACSNLHDFDSSRRGFAQADRHYAKTRLNTHENWPFLGGDRGSRWSAKHVHTKKAHNRPLSRAHKNWPCFLDS